MKFRLFFAFSFILLAVGVFIDTAPAMADRCHFLDITCSPPRPPSGNSLPPRPTSSVPNAIVQTSGQPALAVFPERRESFALGCSFSSLWRGIRTEQVSSTVYVATQRDNPVVADIHCDGRVQGFAPQGEPGALVIPYRDGSRRRHYIDNIEFARVITGTDRLIPISTQEFYQQFPQRGTDFRRW